MVHLLFICTHDCKRDTRNYFYYTLKTKVQKLGIDLETLSLVFLYRKICVTSWQNSCLRDTVMSRNTEYPETYLKIYEKSIREHLKYELS